MSTGVLNATALAGVIEQEIADLDTGARIEGEHALARRFGVTRTVVRSALASLEARFLLAGCEAPARSWPGASTSS